MEPLADVEVPGLGCGANCGVAPLAVVAVLQSLE